MRRPPPRRRRRARPARVARRRGRRPGGRRRSGARVRSRPAPPRSRVPPAPARPFHARAGRAPGWRPTVGPPRRAPPARRRPRARRRAARAAACSAAPAGRRAGPRPPSAPGRSRRARWRWSPTARPSRRMVVPRSPPRAALKSMSRSTAVSSRFAAGCSSLSRTSRIFSSPSCDPGSRLCMCVTAAATSSLGPLGRRHERLLPVETGRAWYRAQSCSSEVSASSMRRAIDARAPLQRRVEIVVADQGDAAQIGAQEREVLDAGRGVLGDQRGRAPDLHVAPLGEDGRQDEGSCHDPEGDRGASARMSRCAFDPSA